jgi:site-specific recombinase XerD
MSSLVRCVSVVKRAAARRTIDAPQRTGLAVADRRRRLAAVGTLDPGRPPRRSQHRTVRAGAKGGKPRNVLIPRRTLAAIDAYLDERTGLLGAAPDRARLFVRHDGKPLSQQVIDRTLRRLAAAAGVSPPDGAMAHALRHTYGMDLAMRSVPLSVIQQLMGHDDPRTTSIYTVAHAEDLSAALAEAGAL